MSSKTSNNATSTSAWSNPSHSTEEGSTEAITGATYDTKSHTAFPEEYLCPLNRVGLQGDDATYPEHDIPPRGGASIVACQGSLYVFGGASREGTHMNDLIKLDADTLSVSKRLTQPTCGPDDSVEALKQQYPPPLAGHTCVVYGTFLVVFGGMDLSHELISNDLWVFNTETERWHKVDLPDTGKPPARNGHGAVMHNNKMYIFGGSSPETGPLNDFWVFEFELDDNNTTTRQQVDKGKWSKVKQTTTKPAGAGASTNTSSSSSVPAARELHCMFLVDSHAGTKENGTKPVPGSFKQSHIAVFGGRGKDFGPLSDMHLFDLENHQWMELTMPQLEEESAACRIAACSSHKTDAAGRIPIFGGWDGDTTVFADAIVIQFAPDFSVSVKQTSVGGGTGIARFASTACMRTSVEEGYHIETHYIFGGCGPSADTNNMARARMFEDFTSS